MPALSNYALSQKIDLSGDRGEALNHMCSPHYFSFHCVCGCMCLLTDKRQARIFSHSVTDSVIKRDYEWPILQIILSSHMTRFTTEPLINSRLVICEILVCYI